jgi:hypothetical protein
MQVLEKSGERGRNRTYNLLIKSQLLCQLSYAPLLTQGENETELYHLVCSTQIRGIETQSRGRSFAWTGCDLDDSRVRAVARDPTCARQTRCG